MFSFNEDCIQENCQIILDIFLFKTIFYCILVGDKNYSSVSEKWLCAYKHNLSLVVVITVLFQMAKKNYYFFQLLSEIYT